MREPDTATILDLRDGPSLRAYAEDVLRGATDGKVADAIHLIATSIGVSAIARDLGIPRERLCEAFHDDASPGGLGPRDVLLAIACGRRPPDAGI